MTADGVFGWVANGYGNNLASKDADFKCGLMVLDDGGATMVTISRLNNGKALADERSRMALRILSVDFWYMSLFWAFSIHLVL